MSGESLQIAMWGDTLENIQADAAKNLQIDFGIPVIAPASEEGESGA